MFREGRERFTTGTGTMQSSTIANNNATSSTPATSTTASVASTSARIRSGGSSFNNEDEDCGVMSNGHPIIVNNGNRSNSILSSYLILSPSNPLRIFAISFLTHWIYPTVIVLTVCAFVASSVYCTFQSNHDRIQGEPAAEVHEPEEIPTRSFSILEVTRWLLFITILSEILIKSLARGFFVGSKFAYLRIVWDWMDIASLVFIFLSIIMPWKTVEFIAAATVLLKLIPIHPGSINAFIFLCSCAKKLIPVLLYGLIIVWIYGFIIFALFVKYQHHPHDHQLQEEELLVHQADEHDTNWAAGFAGVSKSNGSTSDTDENGNIRENSSLPNAPGYVVDGSYLLPPSTSPTILEKSEHLSRGLSMECLPTNFRSLSGSFIQAIEMLSLRYSQDDLSKSTYAFPSPSSSSSSSSGTNTLNLNETRSDEGAASWLCQYETFVLSIIETLVIISGTLPMIIMSFAALSHFFEKTQFDEKSRQNREHEEGEGKDEHSYCHQTSRHNNGGRYGSSSISESHRSSCGQVRQSSSWFNGMGNLLCDCDYYFCCLANLQRRLNPCASGILNSKKFKVFVVLILFTDFLCMIMWWCGLSNSESTSDIDFPATWLIIYYWIQICFILYTVEAVLRWFSVSSDEYWMTVWPAFDLTMVIIYWIGVAVLHVRSCQNYYPTLCGILMIRMLKIVPYWKSLEHSLKLILVSVSSNRQNLLVILLCSCSCILLKYAAFFLGTGWSSQFISRDLIPLLSPDFYTFVESLFRLILYFPCCVVIVTSFGYVVENLRSTPPVDILTPDTTRNPSISLLLSESQHDGEHQHQHPFIPSPRRSLNESSSPISVLSVPNGISHHNKFMFASSPCSSNSNGLLLSNDTRSSILSPSSEVLSPLLSVPNGLNGHAHHHHRSPSMEDHEENIQLGIGNSARNGMKRESFFLPSRPVSVEDVANLITTLVVILALANISLDSSVDSAKEMSWQTLYPRQSLWLEVFFIMSIALHIVYKTRLSRFSRDTFMQVASVIDLIVILSAGAEVFGYGMRWVPSKPGEKGSVQVFAECAKIFSATRGLLLLSRISWLQCVGSGLCDMIWKAIKYLAAFGYFWVVFVISATETQKMMQAKRLGQTEKNVTFTESSNATERTNQPGNKLAFEEVNFMMHPILLTVTMLLFLLSIAVFLGFLRNQIWNLSQLTQKFMTKSQTKNQQHSDALRYQLNFYPVGKGSARQEPVQPTKGICVPILYFVANHRTFDIIVMTVIFLDGLGITLEHFGTSERALILRKHYPSYMIFLYAFEIGSKLVGNGSHFFKSYWNVFDCVILITCTIELCASFISRSWLSLLVQNVRFFRILRIFQFYPFVQRAKIIPQLFNSIPKVVYPLWNFLVFYFCLYLAVLSFRLGCSHIIASDLGQESFTLSMIVAAPFERTNFPSIFETLGNLTFTTYSLERIFYCCGQMLFFLIKLSIIFTLCFVLILILCQHLTEQDLMRMHSWKVHSRSQSFHHDRDHRRCGGGDDDGHLDCDEKSSFMIPCISPDTIDLETPSSAGTSSRLANHNNNMGIITGTSAKCRDDNIDALDKPNNSLYQTTTITSSEEINGCKVFYVEAMITTV